MLKFKFAVLMLLIGVSLSANAQQMANQFKKDMNVTLDSNYLLYLPENYAEQPKWPLMVFLHGSGERGQDIELVKKNGPPMLVEAGQSFPFVILSPQLPENVWWGAELEFATLVALIDQISRDYKIDLERIYLTGLSMGGYGTWQLATEYPDKFAAIAPVCGGGDDTQMSKIAHLPTWVFHGAMDDVVELKESQKMVDALKKVNGRVKFTVYPEADHDSWTPTYNNPELYKWFLQHTRSANLAHKAKQ